MQDWVFRLGSEGLILASTNSQQYYKRLFIELRVQYMLCTQIVLNFETKNQFVYTPSTELSVVILWVSRCKNKCFWHGFTSKLKSIRTDQSKRHISWGKKSGFVDSGFVKTCNELVIGVKQKGSPIHLLIPPSILKELRQKTWKKWWLKLKMRRMIVFMPWSDHHRLQYRRPLLK